MEMHVSGSGFQAHVKCTKCKWFGMVSPLHAGLRGIWFAFTQHVVAEGSSS